MEAIFDFNEYEYMIIESDDGKVIAEIRQDSIDVEDGYRARMMPRKKERRKVMRDHEALTILIEQIGSLTYGKERWFEQDGGIWYDRKQGDHIRLSDVVYRAVGAVYEECESDRDC